MFRIRIVIMISVILSVVLGIFLRERFWEEKIDEGVFLEQLAPDMAFNEKAGALPHYRSESGAVAFNSYDIVPYVRGYAGHIKTMIVLDDSGAVKGLAIMSHRETKNFVHSMLTPEYLSGFIGKSVNDPLAVDVDIDGISRATVSVDALARTVRLSSRKIAQDVLGMQLREAQGDEGKSRSLSWIALLFMFASALYLHAFSRGRVKIQHFRNVFLMVSVIIVGLWLSATFSVLHVFNILLGRIAGDPMWLVIIIGTFGSLAIAGRIYCGWLCPLGAILELLWKVSPFKTAVPVWRDGKYRMAKYILLVLVGASVLLSGRPDLGNIEPYVTLFSFHGSLMAWIVLLFASVLPGLFVSRFWCRYLCPAGGVLALISPHSRGYPGSGRCPMGNLPGDSVEGHPDGSHASECIRCNICTGKVSKS